MNEYLGDGVYIEKTDDHIILRTGDHRDGLCDNIVYLDADVLSSMINWLVRKEIVCFEGYRVGREVSNE